MFDINDFDIEKEEDERRSKKTAFGHNVIFKPVIVQKKSSEIWYKCDKCGLQQYFSTARYDLGDRYMEMTQCDECSYRECEDSVKTFTKEVK